MEAIHGAAASMNGIRTAGDMVMRLQLSEKMKLREAKEYLTQKLGITMEQLSDAVYMTELRTQRGFGTAGIEPYAERSTGIENKLRIARALDIRINCVEKFINSISDRK